MLRFATIAQYCQISTQCVLCGSLHRNKGALCPYCRPLIVPLAEQCARCAIPLPEAEFRICGVCIKKPPPFAAAHANVHYQEPFKSLLHRYKYQQQLFLAEFFMALMVANPPDFLHSDCELLPVPLHPAKLRQRGFNPVAEIARGLARQLGLSFSGNLCQKKRATPPQASLDSLARRRNLQGCFECAPVTGRCLILVDDLMTSGSTAAELSRSLYRAGAREVRVWCLARASLNQT